MNANDWSFSGSVMREYQPSKKITLALAVVARVGRAPRLLGAKTAAVAGEQQQDGWPWHCRMHGSVLVLR